MPQVFNAHTCWEKWIDHRQLLWTTLDQPFPTNRGARLNNINTYFQQHPDANNRQAQFERDTGFWYGAMMHPGTSNRITLRKVFAILYYGGLMYRGHQGWESWRSLRIPIAAAISHSARVVVQLPIPNPQGANSYIWDWLNLERSIRPRGAATHGIERVSRYATNLPTGLAAEVVARGGTIQPVPPPVEEVNNVPKYVSERKAMTGMFDDHYYMNVALGGQGRINPFSGTPIDAEGQHGHLYFCYKAPTDAEVGGLLLATEQSAPADVMLPDANPFTQFALAKHGVDDQWGGTHGLGGHNQYSATGGNDWTHDELLGIGPVEYLDGMYVDLSQPYQYNHVLTNWGNFNPNLLGWTGEGPPAPPRPQAPAPRQAPPGRQLPNNNLRTARRGGAPRPPGF